MSLSLDLLSVLVMVFALIRIMRKLRLGVTGCIRDHDALFDFACFPVSVFLTGYWEPLGGKKGKKG